MTDADDAQQRSAPKQPFFARFLERQDPAALQMTVQTAVRAAGGPPTRKYPSDHDEW